MHNGGAMMTGPMIFLDCPGFLDEEGAVRCGLPAEVKTRYTMCSTDHAWLAKLVSHPSAASETLHQRLRSQLESRVQ